MEAFVNCVMELIMRLSDVEAFAIPVLQEVLPAKLAKSFFDKYSTAKKKVPLNNIKKLTAECAYWIASEDYTKILYSIYGPDANLPIPPHLAREITKMMVGADYESQCKLSLLLINNNYTRHHTLFDIVDDTKFGDWEERIWKKICVLAPNKLQHIEMNTDDQSKLPKYNPINIALPYLARFKNLHTLMMFGTPLNDNHFVEIAQAVQNLKIIGFGFKKDLCVSDVGVQALSCLAKLQEIHFDVDEEHDFDQDEEEIIYKQMNDLSKRCLKAMPTKLKIVKCDISQYCLRFEHLIPKFEEPTDLALEHLFIREFLERECSNSTLANVRFLYISYLEKVDHANIICEQMKYSKLEDLRANGGYYEALTALMPGLGANLKKIEFELYTFHQSEESLGLDFLLFIDSCPLLESISIHGGEYFFGRRPYQQQIPLHLKTVSIRMENTWDISLPPGSLARLLQSPNLEVFKQDALKADPSDCFQLIELLQSSASKVLSNLKSLNFDFKKEEENEAFSILLVAMVTFCPHLSEVDITNLGKGVVLNLCSRLMERVTFKLNLDK